MNNIKNYKSSLEYNSFLIQLNKGKLYTDWQVVVVYALLFRFHKRYFNVEENREAYHHLHQYSLRKRLHPGEFPAQSPVTRSFDVFFDLCLNKRLSKQSWGWWFETLSRRLWRHRNDMCHSYRNRAMHYSCTRLLNVRWRNGRMISTIDSTINN